MDAWRITRSLPHFHPNRWLNEIRCTFLNHLESFWTVLASRSSKDSPRQLLVVNEKYCFWVVQWWCKPSHPTSPMLTIKKQVESGWLWLHFTFMSSNFARDCWPSFLDVQTEKMCRDFSLATALSCCVTKLKPCRAAAGVLWGHRREKSTWPRSQGPPGKGVSCTLQNPLFVFSLNPFQRKFCVCVGLLMNCNQLIWQHHIKKLRLLRGVAKSSS